MFLTWYADRRINFRIPPRLLRCIAPGGAFPIMQQQERRKMKLTDFLQDVGRPIAYYPALRRVTGSTNATILLCQFIYWRGKEASGDGWLYKTAEEIEAETGLSYNEQKTARRDLVTTGILQEHYARLDHEMRFKIDLDALNSKWGTEESHIPESGKPKFGNDANLNSLNELTETTTETTGAYAPRTIEEAIFAGKPVTNDMLDQKTAEMRDAANLIEMGCPRAGSLALAFMEERGIVFPNSKVKGQRKAAREMLEQGVNAEHVREAVRELVSKGMTVTDLYSVEKTAVNLANKPQAQDSRVRIMETL